jgi:hypothetical protein
VELIAQASFSSYITHSEILLSLFLRRGFRTSYSQITLTMSPLALDFYACCPTWSSHPHENFIPQALYLQLMSSLI